MQAEWHGGVLVGVLKRILVVAGCAIGSAFVAALLAPSSGTAHAASGSGSFGFDPEPTASATATGTSTTSGGDESGAVAVDGSTDAMTLWADPAHLSATAVRRARGASVWSPPSHPSTMPKSAPAPASAQPTVPQSPTGQQVSTSVVAIATPSGAPAPTGGHGSPDARPTVAQLACLMAALGSVLWLSQRVLAGELAWRSVSINLIGERPG